MSVFCLSWLLMMRGAICHFPSERLQLQSAAAAQAALRVFICPGQCNTYVTAIDGLFTQAGGIQTEGWCWFASKSILKHGHFEVLLDVFLFLFFLCSPIVFSHCVQGVAHTSWAMLTLRSGTAPSDIIFATYLCTFIVLIMFYKIPGEAHRLQAVILWMTHLLRRRADKLTSHFVVIYFVPFSVE